MKVKLKLQTGILTQSIEVPDECLKTEYRMPIHRQMKAHLIGEIQDMITSQTTQSKCLIFRFTGSYWGNSNCPIMDLIDVY